MYAFVAVDLTNGEFLAARDPFGVKPLYVMQSGNGFLFCSEMRPLLTTVSEGDVMLLPPGYALSRKNCARFKSPVYPRFDVPVENSPAMLDAILREAVRMRLPPDLPVATLFSGGIDSTLVAHYAREFRPEAPGYFVGGADAPDYRYAVAYAEKTGYDLRMVPFDPHSDEAFAMIDDVVAYTESFEPNLIRGAVCSLAANEYMHRDGFRVNLCGEGADELFCGYAPLEVAFNESTAEGQPVRDEVLGLMNRVSLQRVDPRTECGGTPRGQVLQREAMHRLPERQEQGGDEVVATGAGAERLPLRVVHPVDKPEQVDVLAQWPVHPAAHDVQGDHAGAILRIGNADPSRALAARQDRSGERRADRRLGDARVVALCEICQSGLFRRQLRDRFGYGVDRTGELRFSPA